MATPDPDVIKSAVDAMVLKFLGTSSLPSTNNQFHSDEELDICKAILNDAQSRVSMILGRRNDTVLIHGIPHELLLYIFRLCLPPQDAMNDALYYISLGNLRLVCKHWATMIETTSAFWTLLSFNSRRQRLHKVILERSKNAMLRISANSSHMLPDKLYPLLLPHLQRCEALEFNYFRSTTAGSDDLFLQVLDASAETLKWLRLACSPGQTGPSPSEFFSNKGPSLIGVHLSHMSDIGNCSWLSNLRELSLLSVRTTTHTLFEVMAASPDLRSLVLIHLNLLDIEAPGSDHTTNMSNKALLASLKNLTIIGNQAVATEVLTNLKAPHCSNIYINDVTARPFPGLHAAANPTPSPPHFNSSVQLAQGLSAFLHHVIALPPTTSISIGRNSFALSADRFLIHYQQSNRVRGFKRYRSILQELPRTLTSTVKGVALEPNVRRCPNFIETVHSLFTQTERLSLPRGWAGRNNGLPLLCRPQPHQGGHGNETNQRSFFLPQLREITFTALDNLHGADQHPRIRVLQVKMLRGALNLAKARNKRERGPEGQWIAEQALPDVAMVAKFTYRGTLMDDVKGNALLAGIKTRVPDVQIAPPPPPSQSTHTLFGSTNGELHNLIGSMAFPPIPGGFMATNLMQMQHMAGLFHTPPNNVV